jgi:hypothetical protein
MVRFNFQPHYPWEKAADTNWRGDWLDLRAGLYIVAKEISIFSIAAPI